MQNTVKRVSILIAALLPVVVLGFFVMKKDAPSAVVTAAPVVTTPSAPTPTTTPTPAPAADTTSLVAFGYKDGTYNANVSYQSPGGPNGLGVSVTLVSDIITDVSITEGANDPISQKFQDQFAEGYKVLVVGKSIDDVQLGKISGSSLTPKAFNDALNAIKTQAEV